MPKTLAELLLDFEAAVRAKDKTRATELERTILQRLASEAADRSIVELRVRELMRRLDEPVAKPTTRGIGSFGIIGDVERGGSANDDKGMMYPVWFGTNRKPAADGKGFTGERHDRVTRGRVEVRVPESHQFGSTGTPFWKRMLRLQFTDDHLRIEQIAKLERDAFFAEIQQKLDEARKAGEIGDALFFIHGYKNTFEEAAIRAAQIGVDLKVPVTAFFSWPSRGKLEAYPADEASIEASERAMTDFLLEFSEKCGANKIHVIAHSMGNRGFLRALQRIAANAQTRGKVKFGQIFLAAPDVDRDLFLDLARLYAEHSERTTLYASRGDWPVWLSDKFHDAPRAGYFTPYTVTPGVDTITVPNFDVDLLGHSYFAQAEALLHDIFDLIRNNLDPKLRQRVVAAFEADTSFWRLTK